MLYTWRDALSSLPAKSAPQPKRRPRGTGGRRLVFESLEPRCLLAAMPIISELLASNKSGLQDAFGQYSDWLEIHNPDTEESVDLSNWRLVYKNTTWVFPSMSLGPGEFRVLFATGRDLRDPNGELHTSFNLDKDGANLRLQDPLGTTVFSYLPYPSQQTDVSYGVGQVYSETTLVDLGAIARWYVPVDGSLGATWTQPGFSDISWQQGPTGLGYGELVPGFAVWGYKSSISGSIGNLAMADAILSDPAMQSWCSTETAATINYFNTGGRGRFIYDVTFPGATIGAVESNYVLKANGRVSIPTAGYWMFGVNSDDGFRLSINGASFVAASGTGTAIVGGALQFDGTRGTADSIGVAYFAAPGEYELNLVYFQGASSAAVELFAAPAATNTPRSISSITRSGSTVTVTSNNHGYANGNIIQIAGANQPEYNGFFVISGVTTNTYTYTISGAPSSPATGTITSLRYDLAFNTNTFRLVGDTANGGLAVRSSPFTGPAHSVASLVRTDVRNAIEQAGGSSLYTRITFDAPDLSPEESLVLMMAYDDGYVAYLNGVEIARRNAPASVAWDSRALAPRTSEVQSSTYETIDLSAFLDDSNPNRLQASGNVLAIQALLAPGSDGDLLIAPKIARIASTSLGRHFFTTPTPGTANTSDTWQKADAPTFSAPHGFYDQSVALVLTSSTPGATIYFTLDGSDPSMPYITRSISSITSSGTTATVTSTGHGYTEGSLVCISGATQAAYNGVYAISNVTANTFTYTMATAPGVAASGALSVVKVDRSVSGIVRSGTTATVTSTGHGFSEGDRIRISGAVQTEYNGDFVITNVTANTFAYTITGTPSSPATGSIGATRLGQRYTVPLTLNTTTVVRAVSVKDGFEKSDTVSSTYIFLADIIGQSATPDGFPSNWASWPADYAMDPRITEDPAYKNLLNDALLSLPSMSLSLHRDHLFDPQYGIYANEAISLNPDYNGDPMRVPGSLEYFGPGAGDDFQINAGVNIYGGVGRRPQYKKHSFRIVFSGDYGPTKLQTSLFGAGAVEQFDSIILRSQFNDSWPGNGAIVQYIRDTFASDTHLAMGQPDHHSRWVHLFVDGLYWGIYQATERPDESFAADYMGGDKDDWESNNAGYSDGVTSELPAWNDLLAKTNWGVANRIYQAGAPGFNVTYYAAAASSTPGFTSIYYKSNTTVGNLAEAESVISTASKQVLVSQHNTATVNYLNNGADGRFTTGNAGFPGAGTTATNDFVVEIISSITIGAAGYWSFGVNSDDGFRLTLTNGTDTYTLANDTTMSSPADKIQAFNITQAGDYRLRLVYFQRSGGSELELFAAQGNYSSWSQTSNWRLVGDTAGGGIASYLVLPLTTLAAAEDILKSSAKQAWSYSSVFSTINFLNVGADGRYTSNNSQFPGTAAGTPGQGFVIEANSSIFIPTTGAWTFGVNSDDGFRLQLIRNDTTVLDSSYSGLRTPGDTLQTVNITEAGLYTLRLVYFQGTTAGAELELYAAKGSFSSWSATTAWQLVNSNVTATTNPGLAALASVINVASIADAENIITQPSLSPAGAAPRLAVASITSAGTTATVTLAGHGFVNGQRVQISGAGESAYNGTFVISGVTADTFNYSMSSAPSAPARGALFAQAMTLPVAGITRVGTTATVTLAGHGFVNGETILISGANESAYNGSFVISNVTPNTFSYTVSGTPSTPASGAIFAQPYGITRSGAVAIVHLPGHGFSDGDVVNISGASQGQYNGTFVITAATANTFSYKVLGAPATIATGAITVRRNVQAWTSTQNTATVNFLSTGSDGRFGSSVVFPGTSGFGSSGVAVQNVVMESRTTVSIPAAGWWTFGVSSDEDFRLTLTRDDETVLDVSYAGTRTPGDTLQSVFIDTPGAYRLRLVYFQRTGGAEIEVFAAPGQWSSWSETTAWRLVGDHAKLGLGASLADLAAVTVYQANIPITNLAAAQSVIDDPSKHISAAREYRNVVNFLDTGNQGHFAADTLFPGVGSDGRNAVEDFVVAVEAAVTVATAGTWTFGVFCDDGFLFRLRDGVNVLGEMRYDGLRGMTDTLTTVVIPRAGVYTVELVYYQHDGDAGVELFAASGAKTAFNPADFRLLGDTVNGGLAFGSGVYNAEMFYALMGQNPDGSRNTNYPVLLDMHNYIDYMLLNFYLGNSDWPSHNFYAARPNGPDSTGYKSFSWDAEWSVGLNSDLYKNQLGVNVMIARPYYYLVAVPEFRMMFADHVQRHMFNGGALTPEASIARYAELARTIELAVIAESARWGDVNQTTPDTPAMWTAQRDWTLTTYLPQRTAVVLQQLRDAGLYPQIDAPAFALNGRAQHGGAFDPGDVLSITAPSGTVYYTLDGTDPRLPGGGLNPAAIAYVGPIVPSQSATLAARAFDGGQWSALSVAAFYANLAPSIRLTELMYTPAAPSAAEIAAGFFDANLFEYLEITNIGTQPLPLGGLRLTKGVSFEFPNVIIEPGQFKLVVANAAAFRFRYGDALRARFGDAWESLLVVGQYSGRLDGVGEKIILESPMGGVIHEFTYSDDWYKHTDGDGFSLTVRSPGQSLSLWDESGGWRSSAAPGGTPGYDDVLVAPGAIIINEVLSHTSPTQGDMIELHNTTDQPIDIGGWFLSDRRSDLQMYQIAAGTIIAPKGYLVLTELSHFGNTADPGCRAPFALSEHGDEVYLSSNANGAAGGYRERVDFGAAPEGVSTGLHTRSTGGTDFTLLQTPTFGTGPDYSGGANSVPYIAPLVLSEIMYHPAAPTSAEIAAGFTDADAFEFIELYNRSESVLSLAEFHIGAGVGFSFGWYSNGMGSELWTLESGATATWNCPELLNGEYEVLVHFTLIDGDGKRRDLDDSARYTINAVGGPITVTVDQNQPAISAADVWVSLGSFAFAGAGSVQLARGLTAVGGWTIADTVKFVRPGHEVVAASPLLDSFATRSGRTTLAPGERLVLVRDYAAFDARYGIAANNIPVAGVYSGGLNNDGEMLRLYQAGNPDPGVIPRYEIDRVNYSDRNNWPSKPDGNGPALMRIRPAGYGNDSINWRATQLGGTPGGENVPIDKTPPSVPDGLVATAQFAPGAQVSLSWAPSVDVDSPVGHYVIYRDGIAIGVSSVPAYTDSGVQPAVSYVYQVAAVNRDGYESNRAAIVASVPGVVSYLLIDITHIEVRFSEPLNPATAASLDRYVFSGGELAGVSLAGNDTRIILTTASPMTPGASYALTINGLTTRAGSQLPAALPLSFTFVPQGVGYLLREYWTGLNTGGAVADLTSNPNFPNNPSGSNYIASFEAPVSFGDYYGTRIRGYIVPPVSGGYTFWIASDDSSELWLSTDENPNNKVKIAYVSGWTNSREWTKFTTQYNAVPIQLEAGRRYYIEALHKEGSGGDNLAVRWQLPGGVWENNDPALPIPGIRLSPFGPDIDATSPAAVEGLRARVGADNASVVLSWNPAVEVDGVVADYVIYRNGAVYAYSTEPTFADVNVSTATRHTYQVSARNASRIEGARSASLVIGPAGIASAIATDPTTVYLTFTEPLDRAAAEQAANYAISSGGAPFAPLAAALAGDGRTVILTVPTMGLGSVWQVVAAGVLGRDGPLPAAGLQASFKYGGGILREYWLNIGSGTAVSNLTGLSAFPGGFSQQEVRSLFESPVNQFTNSGERMRGYIVPETTGDYCFYIASDDSSELWLSSDDDPANRTLIASVSGSTGSREWTKFASQKSVFVHLVAGHRYYIEAIQKQGGGGGNLAVAWQRNGTTFDGLPIDGRFLVPAAPYVVAQPMSITVGNYNGSDPTPSVGGAVSDVVGAVTVRVGDVYYAATNNGNFTWRLADNVVQPLLDGSYPLTVCVNNGYGRVSYATSLGAVNIDTVAPTVAIGSLPPGPHQAGVDQVTITFSEPIEDFDLGDLVLTRNGGSNLLTGAETLTTVDNRVWILGNLAPLTSRSGNYLLALPSSGSGIEDGGGNHLLSGATASWLIDATPPQVVNVLLGSTAWSGRFLDSLASLGPMHVGGWSIGVGSGASQWQAAPWTNINQIRIVFSEDVSVDRDDLSLFGVSRSAYDLSDAVFGYDSATFTATWTLPTAIAADVLELVLNADSSSPITDWAGNRLDGEWTNPAGPSDPNGASYPSGDGTAGGDFRFRFAVLPGDVDGDLAVTQADVDHVAASVRPFAAVGADAMCDLNGSGLVNATDVLLARRQLGQTLVVPPPVLPATGSVGLGDSAEIAGAPQVISETTVLLSAVPESGVAAQPAAAPVVEELASGSIADVVVDPVANAPDVARRAEAAGTRWRAALLYADWLLEPRFGSLADELTDSLTTPGRRRLAVGLRDPRVAAFAEGGSSAMRPTTAFSRSRPVRNFWATGLSD